MNKFLTRIKKSHRLNIAKGHYHDWESWSNIIEQCYPSRKNILDEKQYKDLAEQDLYAAILEYQGLKIEWTGGDTPEDINFVDANKPRTIKTITGLNEKSNLITRNSYNLSGASVVSTKRFNIDPDEKENMILMSNGTYHESLRTDWAPGKFGNVKFIGHSEIQSFLNDEKFWNFYKSRIKNFTRPENNIEILIPEEWQEPAIEALLSWEKYGCIIAGTGGGKTFIFSYSIARSIKSLESRHRNKKYIIVAPSLLLGRQTLNCQAECIKSVYNNPVKFLVVNSAGDNTDEVEALMGESICGNIPNTTKPREIENEIDRANQKNVPMVIVTTYMSLHILYNILKKKGEKIEILIFDEAHNLVKGHLCGKPRIGQKELSDREYADMMEEISDRVRYVTATIPKSFDGRKGFDLNGKHKILYSITNGELIAKGIIVPLKPIYVDIGKIIRKNKNGEYDLQDPHNQSRVINDITQDLQIRTAKDSKSPNTIAGRLLAKFPNSLNLDAFNGSDGQEKMIEDGITTYTISCLKGLHKNGIKYDKSDFRHEYLKEQKELPSYEPSTSGYVQMLGEGIDVRSFMGIVTFEPLIDPITRTQTLGRIMRGDHEDRKMIQKCKPAIEELNNWRKNQKLNKPYAYVYILMWTDGSCDYQKEIRKLVKRDFGEMIGEIQSPVVCRINVPDEHPIGPSDGGKFTSDTNTPTDHSNIEDIELTYSMDSEPLTSSDLKEIKIEIEDEERQKEIDEMEEKEYEILYQKTKKNFSADLQKYLP
jgi:superfamily II DNA or RNA helicase